jgi:hypothetical protein
VIALLNRKDNFDNIYLPIEAIAMISKTNEQQISEVAPKVTPKLLLLFRDCQEFSSLSSDLLTLFKLWCNYQKCREMFIDQFLPFIVGIIQQYYLTTANSDKKVGQRLSLANLQQLSDE